ncbi:MAG: hypothetical protein FWD87_01140 [Spirochaetaceae bacterium]|nr:hypothetical protein [Spirochaetaceae bacterium]
MKKVLLLFIFLSLFIFSCRDSDTSQLKRETLFNIRYGNMDDQIDISFNRHTFSINPAHVRMVDGIIYVLNSNLRKVMKFTSFGDLIALIGRRDENSTPVLFEENDPLEVVNRRAVFFPFNNIGTIRVDRRQHIYVSDLLPRERHEFDEVNNIVLSHIIYKFDNNANFINSLGQDGVGGKPFPFIKSIETNNNNDIIVVTITEAKKIVFWFSAEGNLKYRVELDEDSIPFPVGDLNFFYSIETIKPSSIGYLLYIKTQYYERKIDPITGMQSDFDFYKSFINVLDLQAGTYINMIEIPEVYTSPLGQSNFMQKPMRVLYDFMDIVNNRYLFLSSKINDRTLQILILDTDGRAVGQSRINIDFENYHHIDIDVSNEGIITALLAGDSEANIVWWRANSILRRGR